MFSLRRSSFIGVFRMQGCKQRVTIWSRCRDGDAEQFVRRVLPVDCKWKSSIGRDMAASGARMDNSFTVIVPACAAYMAPEEWVAASMAERAGRFTVQLGDLMALGEHEREITGTAPDTKSGMRQQLAPECLEVHRVEDFSKGMVRGGYLRIGGA